MGSQILQEGGYRSRGGGIAHSLFGFAFVLVGGYRGFEKLMKALVGVMGVSILLCAALTFHEPAAVFTGIFVPHIPSGAGLYVLSIMGGIGGTVTILSYNYWMREEQQDQGKVQ